MNETLLIAFVGGSSIAAIISSGTSIALWFLNNKKKKTDRSDCVIEALQLLLYINIKQMGLEYIRRGNITADELEDLERLHKVYHDKDKLNGNGYLKDIMEKVRKLPIAS